MKAYKPLLLKEDEEGCPCEKCQQKESCKEMCEADVSMCKSRGQDYSSGADMCHRPCPTGQIFNPNQRKCIPHAKK